MVSCLSPNGSTTFVGSELPERLVVATVEGTVTAVRAGDVYEVIARGLIERHVSTVCFEPTRGAIFAGSYTGGVYVSRDAGETWELTGPELAERNVYTIAAHAVGNEVTLYAGTEPVGLFMSTDYGTSWTELPAIREMPNREKWTFPGPPHDAHLKNMTFDADDPALLYVSVEQGGLFSSHDAGATFTELEGIDQPDDDWYRDVHRILIHPRGRERLFITGGDGLTASRDGGETWTRVLPTTFAIGYPDGLVVNPLEPDLMFVSGARHQPGTWRGAGSADAHVARSRDTGATWEIVSNGFPDPLHGNIEALSLAAAPGACEVLAGTTDGEVFASTDGGEHFSLVLSGLGPVSKGGHYRGLVAAP